MRQLVLLLLPLLLISTACKRTKALYEKGEYDRAVFNSIERLRNSPSNKKSRETLKLAYPALVDYLETEIAQAKQTARPLRWERIMAHYALLNRVHDDILRSPAARRVIPHPKDYTRKQAEASRNAAEARYELGMVELRQGRAGDRGAAKAAYTHFMRAHELRNGYRDAREQAERARSLATLFVEFERIPLGQQSLRLSNDFFQNQIFEFASSTDLGPFVHMYPTGQLRAAHQPDHIVRMSFSEFTVGRTRLRETEAERNREVVIEEIQVSEDSVREVMGKVEATVHRFEKTIESSGELDVQIIDARTGAVISHRQFPGTYIWYDRWGYVDGDRRALDDEDEQFVRKRRPGSEPNAQYLFEQFTRPIRDQAVRYLRDYYRNL